MGAAVQNSLAVLAGGAGSQLPPTHPVPWPCPPPAAPPQLSSMHSSRALPWLISAPTCPALAPLAPLPPLPPFAPPGEKVWRRPWQHCSQREDYWTVYKFQIRITMPSPMPFHHSNVVRLLTRKDSCATSRVPIEGTICSANNLHNVRSSFTSSWKREFHQQKNHRSIRTVRQWWRTTGSCTDTNSMVQRIRCSLGMLRHIVRYVYNTTWLTSNIVFVPLFLQRVM